jgi:hypothetical protein
LVPFREALSNRATGRPLRTVGRFAIRGGLERPSAALGGNFHDLMEIVD